MQKIDLKKEYPHLYKASANKYDVVTVPELSYLMMDGSGDPNNSQQFQEATGALYSIAYTIKFMVKKGEQQIDFGVMPLEGLWWTDNMSGFSMEHKDKWKWTLMILQPDFVSDAIVALAREQVIKKKKLTSVEAVRLERMNEGLCAQTLHIGPYSEEPPTIVKLHTFIKENGYQLHNKHREIYLNDMRRTAPDKLKTIIRQPIVKQQ